MAVDIKPLGEIHREYNSKLKEVLLNNIQPLESTFIPSGDDTENLMKIDVASHKRDVDYILSVLKSEDSLYVSRALTSSTWLVTEQEYAHIINPQYLQEHLFPHMTTKNYIKLIKHIKLTLKDESRAEKFYSSENDPKRALKWLPLCSVTFVEHNIESHIDHLTELDFKKICEKTTSVFELVINTLSLWNRHRYLQAVTFLLHINADLYLKVLEISMENQCFIILSDKATDLIMKHSPQKVIDNFKDYSHCVHFPTFAKYLKKDCLKTFLYTEADNDNYYLSQDNNIKYILKRLPNDEQFKFVKEVFIEKVYKNVPTENVLPNTEVHGKMMLDRLFSHYNTFKWYEYATFETAYTAFKQEITDDMHFESKCSMLEVLVTCAGKDLQHIRTVLLYFHGEHKKTPNRPDLTFIKFEFLKHILLVTNINDYDEATWNVLNQIFIDMEVYEEDVSDSSECVQSIIVYTILHSQTTVPAVIEKKNNFNTLKSYQKILNVKQKEKIFSYLYMNFSSKLIDHIDNKDDFVKSIETLKAVLNLLVDWQKELIDYPLILNTIKKYVKLNEENSWEVDLSPFYNMNKKWRPLLFEESLSLWCNEQSCLNALKHSPRLLERHIAEMRALRAQERATPRRLLAKMRIYWPHTIAQEWTDEYTKALEENITAHKTLLRGFCTLLNKEQLMNKIKECAPEKAKIDWNELEQDISLRRYLAGNMHVARPQPSPDAVLLYTKGDYIKFALPSVLAIYYNLSPSSIRMHITKLLDVPVSLQKHGLRFTFLRFNFNEFRDIFLNFWQTSKNLTIRSHLFNFTYTRLCNEKDESKILQLWAIIETFIDNLSFKEDKKIYELLFEVEKVPLVVRGKYLMKSHNFLQKFLPNATSVHENYERRISGLCEYSRNVMEFLSTDFVTGLVNAFLDKEYYKQSVSAHGMIPVISAYLLSASDEQTQTQRYEDMLVPIMQRSLQMWNEDADGKDFIIFNFQKLILYLLRDLRYYVVCNNFIVPTKMLVNIQNELNKSLTMEKNYVLLTTWKLVVALTKLVEAPYAVCYDWTTICGRIVTEFGKICLEYMKEDVKVHFNCIYLLFAKALHNVMLTFIPEYSYIKFYEQLLSDEEFIPAYLVTIRLGADKYENIKELLISNNSVEVMFHCGNRICT